MAIKIKTKLAKRISYGDKRDLSLIRYIVIHYTGNKRDTAKANANYFATSNTRQAGAHFFIDKNGEIWKSINMNRTAWAVGGSKYANECSKGGGKYYSVCRNLNSVSIELCDCITNTNWAQMLACRELVLYIQKKCPNAKTIIRHWDVTGKPCPGCMSGKHNAKWNNFHNFLTGNTSFKARVLQKAALRSSPKITSNNKTGVKTIGSDITIIKLNGMWGKLKNPDSNGNSRWISLKKINKIQ